MAKKHPCPPPQLTESQRGKDYILTQSFDMNEEGNDELEVIDVKRRRNVVIDDDDDDDDDDKEEGDKALFVADSGASSAVKFTLQGGEIKEHLRPQTSSRLTEQHRLRQLPSSDTSECLEAQFCGFCAVEAPQFVMYLRCSRW